VYSTIIPTQPQHRLPFVLQLSPYELEADILSSLLALFTLLRILPNSSARLKSLGYVPFSLPQQRSTAVSLNAIADLQREDIRGIYSEPPVALRVEPTSPERELLYKPPTKSDTPARLTGRVTQGWNKTLKMGRVKNRKRMQNEPPPSQGTVVRKAKRSGIPPCESQVSR